MSAPSAGSTSPAEGRKFASSISRLLPEHRYAGIGTALLNDLLAEAANAGKPVRIYVEHLSPALRLFGRLGFSPFEESGLHVLMQWRLRA